MGRFTRDTNWYLVALILVVAGCTTVRNERLRTETSMITPDTFFAGDKSVKQYDKAYLEDLKNNRKITPYLYDCLVGNVKRGIKGIEKASLVKNTAELRLDLGNCYFIDTQWSKASIVYSQTLAMTSNKKIHALIFNNLAYAYAKQGFPQQALQYFDQAYRYDSSNQIARFNSTIIQLSFGDYKKGIAQMNSRFRNSSDPYILQAKVLAMTAYAPNSINDKDLPKNYDQLKDKTYIKALIKTNSLKGNGRLLELKKVNQSKLTNFAKIVLQSQIKHLERQIAHEKDRAIIYERQRARAIPPTK